MKIHLFSIQVKKENLIYIPFYIALILAFYIALILAVMSPMEMHLRRGDQFHEMLYQRTGSIFSPRMENSGFLASRNFTDINRFYSLLQRQQPTHAFDLKSSTFRYTLSRMYM